MQIIGIMTLWCFFRFLYGWWNENKIGRDINHVPSNDIEIEEIKTDTENEMKDVNSDMSNAMTLNSNKMEKKQTRELFLETLLKIGCQYLIDEEDKRILFSYQGENFVVDAADENSYICIWDMFWGSIELYDIEEFSRLKKAINRSNLNFSPNTVYTINKERSTIDVHCKSIILFISSIPEIDNYLRMELNDFFQVHRYVEGELAKLRREEVNV